MWGNLYTEGTYHIFYQYYPYGKCWGEPMIAHASGNNLYGWSYERAEFDIDNISDVNSGSMIIDDSDKAGYGLNSILYFYCKSNEKNKVFVNCSKRIGEKFGKTEIVITVPEMEGLSAVNPKVIKYNKDNKWIMLLSGGNKVIIMSSENLKDWKFESTFPFDDKYVETGIYNPDLVEFNISKNESKWVLFYNIKSNLYSGSAARYIVGDFDGSKFTGDLKNTLSLDFGRDFTTPSVWSNDNNGKKYLVGWMDNYSYANLTPNIIYTNCKTIPRELILTKKDKSYTLKTQPTNEFNSIAKLNKFVGIVNIDKDYSIPDLITEMKGSYKIEFTVEPTIKSLNMVLSNSTQEFVSIDLNFAENKFNVDRSMSGIVNFSPDFKGASEGQLPATLPKKGSKTGYYKVSLFVDKSSVEVFINDGEAVISSLIFPKEAYQNISFNKLGGNIMLSDFAIQGFDFNMAALTLSWLDWVEGTDKRN